MKNTFIKYKIDQKETSSPISYCTFYSNCVLIKDQIDEYQTVIIPNGEWEYVEEEIAILNYTYHQHLDYEIYQRRYNQELKTKRHEWYIQTYPKDFRNYNINIEILFDKQVHELYSIYSGFRKLKNIIRNNDPLPEWAKDYDDLLLSDVLLEIDLTFKEENYWKSYFQETITKFPDECLSIESWLKQLNN